MLISFQLVFSLFRVSFQFSKDLFKRNVPKDFECMSEDGLTSEVKESLVMLTVNYCHYHHHHYHNHCNYHCRNLHNHVNDNYHHNHNDHHNHHNEPYHYYMGNRSSLNRNHCNHNHFIDHSHHDHNHVNHPNHHIIMIIIITIMISNCYHIGDHNDRNRDHYNHNHFIHHNHHDHSRINYLKHHNHNVHRCRDTSVIRSLSIELRVNGLNPTSAKLSLAVRKDVSSSVSHKSSFIPRTCNLWNVLPSSCFPESYNLPSFKSNINKLDLISLSS